jgi:hypothetical protein
VGGLNVSYLDKRGDRKRGKRRAEAIHFYAGVNGGGKSYAMVYDTLPSLAMGRPVLSTVRLFDPDRQASCEAEAREAWEAHGVLDHGKHSDPLGLPHPSYRRLTRWHQLLDFDYGDVLLDEVQGVISSRGHGTTPGAIVNALLQLRRGDVLLRATAPSFARVDVAIREVTQALTYCTGLMPEQLDGRLWGASRLFLWRTFNARDFDEWDAGKREDTPRSVRQWLWRPRHPEVTSVYDTFAPVDTIADLSEAGNCLRCGGSRRRPKCVCEPARASSEDAARSARPEQDASEVVAVLDVADTRTDQNTNGRDAA